MRRHGLLLVLLGVGGAIGGVAAGCSDDDDKGSTTPTPTTTTTSTVPNTPTGPAPLFRLPASVEELGQGCSADGLTSDDGECASSFFDHPFPSDFRRDEAGKVRFANYINPRSLPPIKTYTDTADRLLDGFSLQAPGYVRFGAPVEAVELQPNTIMPAGTTSKILLVDVDDASPDKGKSHPISLYFRDKPGIYWPPFTLAWSPTLGVLLRPKTRYAFVVLDGAFRAKGGGTLGRSPELDGILGRAGGASTDAVTKLKASWAPAVAALNAASITTDSIVHLSVFTTGDPAAELFAARDVLRESFPAPKVNTWEVHEKTSSYDVYQGMYGPSPNFQKGKVPFAKPEDGGGFEIENGKPKVQQDSTFDLRFALAVPNASTCPPPAEGYPIVLYAHGTGGNYRSFLNDDTAAALADRCVASMGIDQIFHGTRPGAPPDGPNVENEIALLFFNVNNPTAARTNGRQAALDEVQRARLFTETKTSIPASVSNTKAEIRFDPTKVMFFGHSQGGQNGPLYLAIDDSARGGVLSGSGGVISIALLEKTEPAPSVAAAVRSIFLGLSPQNYEELNLMHPALSLAQSLVDASDPINYVRHIILDPRAGFAPKSIYQTEGINPDNTGDHYTPPHAIEVQAVATGLPLMEPSVRPIAEMAVAGISSITIPASGLSGNLAGGKASGVLAQWPPGSGEGHFVVFDVPKARAQAAQFCRNLADNPVGLVPAP